MDEQPVPVLGTIPEVSSSASEHLQTGFAAVASPSHRSFHGSRGKHAEHATESPAQVCTTLSTWQQALKTLHAAVCLQFRDDEHKNSCLPPPPSRYRALLNAAIRIDEHIV